MLTDRITCLFSMKKYLPYNTFCSESSYSAAYTSYNFCNRSKLFAVLNLPVLCLVESWYFVFKICIKSLSNESIKNETNDFIACSSRK